MKELVEVREEHLDRAIAARGKEATIKSCVFAQALKDHFKSNDVICSYQSGTVTTKRFGLFDYTKRVEFNSTELAVPFDNNKYTQVRKLLPCVIEVDINK